MNAYQGSAGLAPTMSSVRMNAAKANGLSVVAVRSPGDKNNWTKLWDAVRESTKPTGDAQH